MIDFQPTVEPPAEAAGLVFAFHDGRLLVDEAYRPPRLEDLPGLGLAPLRTQFLGHWQGTPCWSAELPAETEAPPKMQLRDLRGLYGRLDAPLRALAARAVQIVDWDRSHRYCGACGAPTERSPRERVRTCSNPDCRRPFYPRLAPAMIVAVERGPEILLARSPRFPEGLYSVLAGFVEPGESVEEAVHREVHEETAVRVRNVEYVASQPWPFPNSLMLAYRAEYAGGDIVPEPGEIEDAGFYHVNALPERLPSETSIAHRLIQDFIRRHA